LRASARRTSVDGTKARTQLGFPAGGKSNRHGPDPLTSVDGTGALNQRALTADRCLSNHLLGIAMAGRKASGLRRHIAPVHLTVAIEDNEKDGPGMQIDASIESTGEWNERAHGEAQGGQPMNRATFALLLASGAFVASTS
jgi:hypothetical protein